jgi:HAD superfamily hydrolase (TIGR01549 family)
MKQQSIIWDFDGTIYDTYPRIVDSFDQVINGKYHFSYSLFELRSMIFVDTKYCAKMIAEKHNMSQESLLREVRAYYDLESRINESVFESAKDYIQSTLDSVRHYLVTHRDKQSTLEKLSKASLNRSFETIITKDDGFPEKPNPESFISIIRKSGIPQELFYCIGDRDLDIEAGNNAGIKAIFFSTDGEMREKADFNISDHKQLEKILASSN